MLLSPSLTSRWILMCKREDKMSDSDRLPGAVQLGSTCPPGLGASRGFDQISRSARLLVGPGRGFVVDTVHAHVTINAFKVLLHLV